jgi:D-3-phosphoglycerate dehydrogenase
MKVGNALVVVTDHGFGHLDREAAAAAAAGAAFRNFQCRTVEDVREALAGANVGIVQFAPVDAVAIAGMAAGARLIRYGVGYDNIDLAAARATGRDVAYVPDYCTDEVADHTATLALTLLRRIATLDASIRGGGWSVKDAAPAIAPAGEVLVGLLGLGRIGRATAARLAPFGFRIAVHDPALDASEATALGVSRLDRDALIATADLLILHLPLNPGTRHVLDATRIASMKPGAMIVNTARGGLVEETALDAALRSGHLGGAALDVFEREPLPADSPLRSSPGLILTPHAAWYSTGASARLQSLVAEEIALALAGKPPRCPVPR